MKLNELKQGMICKLRDKGLITVINYGYFSTIDFNVFNLETKYNEDLTHKQYNCDDIMEITYGDKLVFKRNESKSRWFVPEYDEYYFFTSNYGGIGSTINTQFTSDIDILNTNRVFKTREEAEKRLRQQQATLSVERWIAENDVEVDVCDSDVEKYSIVYNTDTKKLKVNYYGVYINVPKQFILSSEEKAEQLIKEREKELKIMLGVE